MNFGSHEAMDDLPYNINKKDEFLESFREVFILEVYTIIMNVNGRCLFNEDMEKSLSVYAIDIVNTVESVVDKDGHYPDYRMEKELDSTTKLMNKVLSVTEEDELLDRLHFCSKQLITWFYPGIINLSNYGFRLLERNTKIYTASFILNLLQKQLIEKE